MCMCIYIYIYICRERERYMYITEVTMSWANTPASQATDENRISQASLPKPIEHIPEGWYIYIYIYIICSKTMHCPSLSLRVYDRRLRQARPDAEVLSFARSFGSWSPMTNLWRPRTSYVPPKSPKWLSSFCVVLRNLSLPKSPQPQKKQETKIRLTRSREKRGAASENRTRSHGDLGGLLGIATVKYNSCYHYIICIHMLTTYNIRIRIRIRIYIYIYICKRIYVNI